MRLFLDAWTPRTSSSRQRGAHGARDGRAVAYDIRASGAHDLHCAARIVTRALYDNPSHRFGTGLVLLADGCGQRATYKLDSHALVLVSIVKVDPPSVPSVATATAPP